MLKYFVKKSLSFVASLFLIATLTFFLMKSIPGDPFSEEQSLRKDMHDSLRKQYGMDQHRTVQFQHYLTDLAKGKLGYSFKYPERSVASIIGDGFPISVRLGLQAFSLALLIGISLGVLSCLRTGHWEEKTTLLLTSFGVATPSFILAALLQYLFAIHLPIFPAARWGGFLHTVLPSLALSAAPMAFIVRMIRCGLKETLQTDYIKQARAKGLPARIWIWRHALPNALLPIFSYLGPLLANVLVGSFVVEKIFSIPGLGQWFVNSVANRDYPLIMGVTLFYSTILLGAVLLVDLLYGFWDPRIRLIKTEG